MGTGGDGTERRIDEGTKGGVHGTSPMRFWRNPEAQP